MKWYITVLKRYTQFSGRASRSEFWWFTLFHTIIVLILFSIDTRTGNLFGLTNEGQLMRLESLDQLNTTQVAQVFGKYMLVYLLLTLLPNLAVSVRRLHDSGKSGWLILLGLIPLLNLVIIIFFILPSERKTNRFGAPPNGLNSNNDHDDSDNNQDSVIM